jgi:spore coat protein SA
VIEHTVRNLRLLRPLVVSPWHPALREASYDRERYRHVRPTALERTLARLPFRLVKRCFGTSERSGVLYVQGLGRVLRRLNPDVIVPHVLPVLSLVARRAVPRARIVHYSHTNDLQDMPPEEWRRFVAAIDGLVTVSRASLASVVDRQGAPQKPTRVILNGVDLEALHPRNRERWRREVRAELGLGSGPVAVFCGRLHPRKGAGELLRAFARLRADVPDAQLLVVGASTHMAAGADPYTRELHGLADACGAGAVRFSGYVPAPQLGRVLAAADVGVLPSVEQEGMPLSILEFAACGMPVVASSVGGVGEVIRDGREGFLIPPDRVDTDLLAPLSALMKDANLRHTLGAAARRRVEEGFGWERVAADFERMIEDFAESWSRQADVRHSGSVYPRARGGPAPWGGGRDDRADAPPRTGRGRVLDR